MVHIKVNKTHPAVKHYLLTDFRHLPLDPAALTSFFIYIFGCGALLWHHFTSLTALLSINFQRS